MVIPIKPCGHPANEICNCGMATMPPDEHIRYLREENARLLQQFERERDLREKEAKRMADYVATIRVLIELSAHHWL